MHDTHTVCVCRYDMLALTKSFFQPTLASDRITPAGGLGNWLHLEELQGSLGNWLHLEEDQAPSKAVWAIDPRESAARFQKSAVCGSARSIFRDWNTLAPNNHIHPPDERSEVGFPTTGRPRWIIRLFTITCLNVYQCLPLYIQCLSVFTNVKTFMLQCLMLLLLTLHV